MNKLFRNRQNSGITLIALVITIVVLIIIASISIGVLTGDSNIIKQATEAQISTELSNVKEAIEIYKIRKHSDEDMSDKELVEDGILKEVFIQDTYRTIGIITNLKEIEVNSKLGKSGAKQNDEEVATILNLYDVYGIDMEDGALYYIRDGIWSIDGTKIKYTVAETGEEKEGYKIETINQKYIEERKFITEWTVDSGTTITLPITKNPNITIEWGSDDDRDGELDIEKCTTAQPTHTYTKSGTYIIKISGYISIWSFGGLVVGIETSKDYITGIKQWGNVSIENINFRNCSNLEGTIPSHNTKGEFSQLTSATEMFAGCTKLTGKIPSDLFKESKNIRDGSFYRCFNNCKSLTGEIPEELFKDCINATSFYQTFDGCSGLTGKIPEKLFINNVKASNFFKCFTGCTGLEGTIPAGLFDTNVEATTFERIFYGCKGITGKIPDGIFKNCSESKNFLLAFADTSITEIPSNLFDTNGGQANQITDLAGVFENTKITTIPEGLFDLCTEVIHFGRNGWAYSGVFQNCTLLETVPKDLFAKNTKVECFADAFNGCTNLKEISGTFTIYESVTSIEEIFSNCKNLKATIKLKANPINYVRAFLYTNSAIFKVNWQSPCTEEKVDEILAVTGGSGIKGIEVIE